ncbi:hypothetical protein [Xylella fastidiosa]|uniref:hypothetical protein n=1 Tax=Xylella fastidiosa TaxID=2371 RepID=UPI00112252B2|nr:hypothetical protein [Xylella fastidiosa]MDD0942074.1 hypothetical protein [Xylella fastidiosa subsp. multiplex]QTX29346.1 hypothetical protein KBP48_07550 [Xylella fastidiosa subsp. multiplex]TNV96709.1 hypothetical protein C5H22_05025 [Xylella fastidiosa]
MNYNRNSNNSGAWVILLIVAIIIVIFGFSKLLGLDPQSGGILLLGLIIVGALSIALIYFFDGLEGIFLTWPILLALVWEFFFPALKYWSSQTFFGLLDPPWWTTWYANIGIFFGIIGLGYLINKIFKDS